MIVPIGPKRSSEEFVQPRLVKPNHSLAIDHNDRGGHEAQVFQFSQGVLILRYIAFGERDSFFGKPRFHSATEQSTGLCVDNHVSGAHPLLFPLMR
jgi:hypothetical protein